MTSYSGHDLGRKLFGPWAAKGAQPSGPMQNRLFKLMWSRLWVVPLLPSGLGIKRGPYPILVQLY